LFFWLKDEHFLCSLFIASLEEGNFLAFPFFIAPAFTSFNRCFHKTYGCHPSGSSAIVCVALKN
jgi:hypothetical protein